MATVKVYMRCGNCNNIVTITRSDTKPMANLILCPICGKNMMVKKI